MENKEITKKNLELTKELICKVKEMSDDEFKTFLSGISKFYNYSFCNQLILWANGCSNVAGFRQWKDKYNRSVKPGAKAVWIIAPNGVRTYTTIKTVKNEDGLEVEKEVLHTVQYYKSVPVFDVKDTEGEPLKNGFESTESLDLKKLVDFAVTSGYTVGYESLPIEVGGYIKDKDIFLNSLITDNHAGTLIHELAHGFLGHNQSNDLQSREIKEQMAETVTYLVCQHLGINRNPNFYLKSWGLDEKIEKQFAQINDVVTKILAGYLQ